MRHIATGIRLLGWAVVAVLGLLALARVVAWDARSPALLGVYGLGPLPYLGALPVALVALARRHVRLGGVALAVAAVVLPTGLPEVAARTALPAGARTAPHLRVLSWNLYEGNSSPAGIDRVVRQADADLVVLQEISTTNLPALQESAALAGYPYRFTTPQPAAFGSGIWSRLPLEGAGEFDVAGLPMTRAQVITPGGPVRLVNVHTLSPVTKDGLDLWPRQLRILGEEARRPGPPIMLAGDFNATWGHHPFRSLLATGLDDAAAARGDPWSPTWPARLSRLPRPLLRLDHLLTGPGLVATSYATGGSGGPGGSDHRSIVADVAVQPVRPA
jgi:endonuclease/exonuclease/phosphatase (EEP) superfamily protein YafD